LQGASESHEHKLSSALSRSVESKIINPNSDSFAQSDFQTVTTAQGSPVMLCHFRGKTNSIVEDYSFQ
jgi:hypothetical protein